jgi:serine/threonine-protein kinase
LREFQRAIDHNPGLADAYHWRATLLSMLGQHAEALREKASALALDPLSVVLRTDLARLYYFAREFDHAEEHYRAALDLDQHFSLAHLGLAQVHEQQGEREQAIAELQAGVRLSNESVFALARLGHGYATAGRREEAQGVIKRLVASGKQKYVSAFDVAMIHVGLGEVDEAFTCFQSAFEERSLWMGYLKVEPQLDPVRADPRFQELLRRVGLA